MFSWSVSYQIPSLLPLNITCMYLMLQLQKPSKTYLFICYMRYKLIVPEPSNLQNLWDLWINCTECCRCKWSRACGAVEWSKWRGSCSSHRTYPSSHSRDQKLLAGSSIPKLLACLHGFCICDILALSLQCTIMILGETIVEISARPPCMFPRAKMAL